LKLIDTGVLVAFFRENDPLHQPAIQLVTRHSHETLLCTGSVLQETLEMIRRNDGNKKALLVAQALFSSSNIEIEPHTREQLVLATQLAGKNSTLSYCDALTATTANLLRIREVLSFDSDFDSIKGLRRLA
jgi:predicted nucleic acid-binding protein